MNKKVMETQLQEISDLIAEKLKEAVTQINPWDKNATKRLEAAAYAMQTLGEVGGWFPHD